jgi:hypothetical protein
VLTGRNSCYFFQLEFRGVVELDYFFFSFFSFPNHVLFPFLGPGFTAKPAMKTSRMKRSSRSANAKTVSNHSCF